MILTNLKIVPMDGPDIECGYIAVKDGKITDLGEMDKLPEAAKALNALGIEGAEKPLAPSQLPSGAKSAKKRTLPGVRPIDGIKELEEVRNCTGLTAYPGFIDAHGHLGLFDDSLGFEGSDGNEETDPVTPQMRAVDGIDHADRCFAEALQAGITTALTGPGSANCIGGQIAAVKTNMRRVDEAAFKPFAAMKFALGENPKTVYRDKEMAPVTRMATAAITREALCKAQRYMEDTDRFENGDGDRPEFDPKYEALLPVLRGEVAAHFHAHRADDIYTAVRLLEEFSLRGVIVHGTEGHLIADTFAGEGLPVICGPIICDRSKPELRNHTVETAAKLAQAGVKVAICTDHPVIPIQYLPLQAGLCVRAGLPYRKALEAITISAAEIAGIADRVGSITPGKDADLALFTGDPLSVYETPKAVMLNGEFVAE